MRGKRLIEIDCGQTEHVMEVGGIIFMDTTRGIVEGMFANP